MIATDMAAVSGFVDWSDPIDWSEPLNRGLVSRWMAVPNFAGYGSFTWRDLCRRNHGTLTGMTPASAWSGSSHRGGWGSLHISSDTYYVNCGSDPSLNIAGAMSVFCWVYPRTFSGFRHIISRFDGGAGWTLLTDGTTLYFGRYGASPNNISTAFPSFNAWHHFGMTYDGTTLRGWIDGVNVTSGAQSGTISSSAAVYIGNNPSNPNQAFIGQFASASIYNRGVDEVAALYQNQLAFSPRTLRRWVRRAYSIPAVAPGGGLLLRRRRMAAA